MNTIIIGVGVKARSGKDTIVKHLIETYKDKYDIRRYAFADILKEELYDALCDSYHPYWEFIEDIYPGSYNTLPKPNNHANESLIKLEWVEANRVALLPHLQRYGTEFRRHGDPFYWVRFLAKRIESDKPQIALISDLRFRSEYLWVKANHGFTIRCTRLGFIDPTRDSKHASETELDNAIFDWAIEVEDGDVAGLCSDAVTVFESIVEVVTPDIPEGECFATV